LFFLFARDGAATGSGNLIASFASTVLINIISTLKKANTKTIPANMSVPASKK
jgi:hypothetical protein